MIFLFLSIIIVLLILYKRYFPVLGVEKINWTDLNLETMKVIDVRDYNDSSNNPIKGAVNIPFGYLHRYYKELTNGSFYVVVSNTLEKNMSIRFLRSKGFKVAGYFLITDHQRNIEHVCQRRECSGLQ
jgi:rhodanese-related sulfurtransferase